MSLTRLVLRLLGACSHPHYRRERDKAGRLHFVCDDCERSWPAMARSPQEHKRLTKLQARIKKQKADMEDAKRGASLPAGVTPMRRRAK